MLSIMTGSLQMSEVDRSAGVGPDLLRCEIWQRREQPMFSSPTSTVHTTIHPIIIHLSPLLPRVTRTNTPYTTHSLMAPTAIPTRYWQRATAGHTSYCDTLVPSCSTASLA